MKLTSLSILIPCFNVENSIKHVIKNAYTTGRVVARSTEIIALDDASNDNTQGKLRTMQKHMPTLKIITHTTNQGYGKTIKELYYAAGNDWLFSLPGDDQFEAAEITKLIPYTQKNDMLLGYRKYRKDSPRRLLQSTIYNSLLNTLFGLSLHDVNTIRLMKKSVIETLTLASNSAFVDAELAIRAKKYGLSIQEIPVAHKLRTEKGATGGKFIKTILPTIVDTFRIGLSMRT